MDREHHHLAERLADRGNVILPVSSSASGLGSDHMTNLVHLLRLFLAGTLVCRICFSIARQPWERLLVLVGQTCVLEIVELDTFHTKTLAFDASRGNDVNQDAPPKLVTLRHVVTGVLYRDGVSHSSRIPRGGGEGLGGYQGR